MTPNSMYFYELALTSSFLRLGGCLKLRSCSLGTRVTSHSNGQRHLVRAPKATCRSKNVIYCLSCKHCGMQYVGMTNDFRIRMNIHKSDFRLYSGNKDHSKYTTTCKLYDHLLEHNQTDFNVMILEHVPVPYITRGNVKDIMWSKLEALEIKWQIRLNVYWPHGLCVNDGYYCQTRKTRKRN